MKVDGSEVMDRAYWDAMVVKRRRLIIFKSNRPVGCVTVHFLVNERSTTVNHVPSTLDLNPKINQILHEEIPMIPKSNDIFYDIIICDT